MSKIGDAIIEFDLPGVDGKNHQTKDYADSKILVLVQSCNHCPYVKGSETRMVSGRRNR